jgi:hypothetical protein
MIYGDAEQEGGNRLPNMPESATNPILLAGSLVM